MTSCSCWNQSNRTHIVWDVINLPLPLINPFDAWHWWKMQEYSMYCCVYTHTHTQVHMLVHAFHRRTYMHTQISFTCLTDWFETHVTKCWHGTDLQRGANCLKVVSFPGNYHQIPQSHPHFSHFILIPLWLRCPPPQTTTKVVHSQGWIWALLCFSSVYPLCFSHTARKVKVSIFFLIDWKTSAEVSAAQEQRRKEKMAAVWAFRQCSGWGCEVNGWDIQRLLGWRSPYKYWQCVEAQKDPVVDVLGAEDGVSPCRGFPFRIELWGAKSWRIKQTVPSTWWRLNRAVNMKSQVWAGFWGDRSDAVWF